jgi:hypothetical protein
LTEDLWALSVPSNDDYRSGSRGILSYANLAFRYAVAA